MVGKWVRTSVNVMKLEGTNYRVVKEIFNGENKCVIYNFNEIVGIADKIREAKAVVKYLMGGK